MIAWTPMLVCVALALTACNPGGEITITVKNESGVAAAGVELRWESHHARLGLLQPGETRVVKMKPQPESGLRVVFDMPSGQHVEDRFDVTYTDDARAAITVTIRPGGEVDFHDPRAGPP